MYEQFGFEDGPDADTRALFASGELDGAAGAEVGRRIEQALAAGKRRVIVDLTQVAYMETAALTALLDANARLARFGASLRLVAPADSRVRRLFSITRLDNVLKVFDSRDAAVRAA